MKEEIELGKEYDGVGVEGLIEGWQRRNKGVCWKRCIV